MSDVLTAADLTQTLPRRQTFVAGQRNEFPYLTEDGGVATGYITLEAVHLTRFAARLQRSNNGRTLIVAQNTLALHNEQVGRVTDEGEDEPHPLYTDPRYEVWRQRGRVLHTQQWMARNKPNFHLLSELANYLDNKDHMVLRHKPPKPRHRQTQDLFAVWDTRTSSRTPDVDPSTIGVPVQAYEVSINEGHPNGFRSFWNACNDQQARLDQLGELLNGRNPDELNEDERAEYDAQVNRVRINSHMLSGAFLNTDPNTQLNGYSARPIDVGVVKIDGTDFYLYRTESDEKLSVDFFERVADLEDHDPDPTTPPTLQQTRPQPVAPAPNGASDDEPF